MEKELRARIVLEDNYSSQILRAVESTNNFKEQIKQVKVAMQSMRNAKVAVDTTEATRQISKTKEAINSIKKNVAVTIAARDEAKESINRIKGNIKVLTSKPVNIIIKAKDMISGTIKSITDKLFSLKTIAAGIILGGTAKFAFDNTIGAGARLEQEQVAMNHFIGNNNKGKKPVEVQKMTDDFIGQLRKNANETPFGTNEVLSAGRRSINIMSGDIGKSMGLVKLAENMAALNPGKNVMDAMEALGDLKTGEFERMKEFGFKFSADQFKALVGKGKNDDLTDSEMTKAYDLLVKNKLNPVFDGGSEKLSKTAAGQWSTTTGNLEAIFSDLGKTFLPAINKVLTPINNALDRVGSSKAFQNLQNDLMNFAEKGANKAVKFLDDLAKDPKKLDEYKNSFKQFIADVKAGWEVAKEFAKAIGTIGTALKPVFSMIAAHPKLFADLFIGMGALKLGTSAFKGISGTFKTLKDIGKEFKILKSSFKIGGTGSLGAVGGIGKLFKGVLKDAKSFGKGLPKIFNDVSGKAKLFGGVIGTVLKNNVMKPFTTLKSTLKGFSIIKPLQDAFKGFKNLGVLKEMPKVLSAAFSPLKPLFSGLGNVIKTFAVGAINVLRPLFAFMLTNPIGIAITAIIAVVILLYEAWKHNWGGIREKTHEAIEFCKTKISSIKTTFSNVETSVITFVENIKKKWEELKFAFSHPIQAIVNYSQTGSVTLPSGTGTTHRMSGASENALGTSYFKGGWTWVGEHGPELMKLPGGSQIIDNRSSQKASGNNVTIEKLADQIIVREDADIDKIATALAKKLTTTAFNM